MFNYKKLVQSSSKLFFFLSLLLVSALIFTACEGFEQQGVGETGVVGQEGVLEEEPVVEDEGVVEQEPLAEEEGVLEEEPLAEEGVVGEEAIEGFSFITAAELIGDDVLNSQMQDWGKVEDMIFGLTSDANDYVVLELNDELLEIVADDTTTLIPLSALSPSVEEDAFFLSSDISADMLLNAPTFTEDQFLGLTDPTWDDETFNYWTDQGLIESDMAEMEEMAATTGPAFIRATDLMGGAVPVSSAAGDSVGLIENVVVSVTPGTATYAVISSNVTGVADQDFVVPLDRLDFSQLAEGMIIFDEDLAMFDEAPVFDQEIVTSPGIITDPVWDDPYADFWGVEDVAVTPGVGQEAVGGFAFVKANELIGDDIMNANMQDWGKVEDVIVGMTPNSSDYVVLELNDEFLDVLTPDTVTLIPLSALSPSGEEDAFFLHSDISGDMLLNAPAFTEDAFLGLNDPTWDDELFGYWQNEGIVGSEFSEAEEMATDGTMAFIRATELTGDDVITGIQDDVGKIDDVILGIQSDVADYAIVSTEGFLDIGDEDYAVPMNQLELTAFEEDAVTLNVSADTLQTAPIFDESVFPGTTLDETWDDELAAFWGIEETAGTQ